MTTWDPSDGRRIRRLRAHVQTQAACHGMSSDLFFPHSSQDPTPAVRVCRGCIVRSRCLELAMATGEKFGVWGGMTETERQLMASASPEEGRAS